jgi:hypothetical protein
MFAGFIELAYSSVFVMLVGLLAFVSVFLMSLAFVFDESRISLMSLVFVFECRISVVFVMSVVFVFL